MKIKHFAGYGCVNAKKVYDSGRLVVVEVWGNHEQGLLRPFNDEYCIERWLGRFFKGRCLDYYQVFDQGSKDIDGIDTEYAFYSLYTKEA